MRLFTFFAVAGLSAIEVQAEEFTCSFGSGVSTTGKDGTFTQFERVTESSPMMLDFVVIGTERLVKEWLAKAKKNGDRNEIEKVQALVERAKLTGYGGWVEGADGFETAVLVIAGDDTLSFVETTTAGNVVTTTLLMKQRTVDGKVPAVHSRHIGMMGTGLVSQYTGGCIRRAKARDGMRVR
jgi:hypothetical protein